MDQNDEKALYNFVYTNSNLSKDNRRNEKRGTIGSQLLKKVLLISEYAPPAVNGPSIVLGNILRSFPQGSYSIFTTDQSRTSCAYDPDTKLNCPYYIFTYPRLLSRIPRSIAVGGVGWFVSAMLVVIREGLKVAKKSRADAILATTGHGPFLIAAYYIHKLSGIPLYVYVLDLYREVPDQPVCRWFARHYERTVLCSAAKVWGMSEPLCELYRQEYGIQVELAPHPVVRSRYSTGMFQPIQNPNEVEIVFTGNLYGAQLDSVVNMAQVVDSMDNLCLTLYVPRSPNVVKELKEKVKGKGIRWSYVDRSGVVEVQQNAGILFLPIAFESEYSQTYLRCASPSKLPEYLAAGRPILVHAPACAYVSWYARQKGFGLVVDEPDTEVLKQAVLSLLSDKSLQRRLVENAQRALLDHDAQSVSLKFQKCLFDGDIQ